PGRRPNSSPLRGLGSASTAAAYPRGSSAREPRPRRCGRTTCTAPWVVLLGIGEPSPPATLTTNGIHHIDRLPQEIWPRRPRLEIQLSAENSAAGSDRPKRFWTPMAHEG